MTKKQMKKIISFAMAFAMLLTMSIPMASAIYDGAPVDVGSVAAGYTPTGKAVNNVAEFVAMETGGTYYLTKDLDFSGTTYTASIWNKIGDLNLDGCGHSLTGITINGTGDVGVFYDLRVGTIKNLKVEATITTTGCAGLTSLSKGGYDTIFENVKLDVNITGGQVGGFCGYAQSGGFKFTKCEVNGTIDGSGSSSSGGNTGVGGFIGRTKKAGEMDFCTNNATIIGNQSNAGGFIGRVQYGFIIDDSVNKGDVSNVSGDSDSGAAGFIGLTQADSGSQGSTMIRGCKNVGEIRGGRDSGGFIGAVANGTNVKGITVQNCINEGDVTGGMYGNGSKGAKAAGIVAEVGTMDILISGCVNKGAITGGTLYDDDGVGAIIGGAVTTSTTGTWELTNNTNEGIVTNTLETTKVSTLAGYTSLATVKASGNTSTVDACGTIFTATGGAAQGFVQFTALNETANTRSLRFILALDEAAVAKIANMNLKISVQQVETDTVNSDGSDVVISQAAVNFNTFGTLYRKFDAAALDIQGGDGVVLYGLIITGVPEAAWNKLALELSATDSTGADIEALAFTGSYERETMKIVDGGESRYKIVYPASADVWAKNTAEYIADRISRSTGVTLDVVTDATAASDYEILVGSTNRGTSGFDTSSWSSYPLYVGVNGNKVLFTADTTIDIFENLSFAMDMWMEEAFVGELGMSNKTCRRMMTAVNSVDDNVITLMVQNLCTWGDAPNTPSERQARVYKEFMYYDPDIIGVSEQSDSWLTYLKKELVTNGEYGRIGDLTLASDGTGNGNNIYYKSSKFSVVSKGTFWYSKTPNTAGTKLSGAELYNVATWAIFKVKSTGKQIMVVNTHLHAYADYGSIRDQQIDILNDFLADYIDQYPVYILGDMNVEEKHTQYATLLETYSDARDIAKYNVSGEDDTYNAYGSYTADGDYILTGKGDNQEILWFKVINEKKFGSYSIADDEWISDHYGVFVQTRIS